MEFKIDYHLFDWALVGGIYEQRNAPFSAVFASGGCLLRLKASQAQRIDKQIELIAAGIANLIVLLVKFSTSQTEWRKRKIAQRAKPLGRTCAAV